ncbi:LuxR C-terminal-related transcriptional regulator [Streptomyces sp. NPDC005407]|uniref:helix-turn-helix transcriptional regulator n=1 Tax=Streptomyces sp. NPDC005407 TaxID=3155340 RepID=UPI0033BC920B
MFVVPSQETDFPMVGRATEAARVTGVLEALAAGQGIVVEIAGDPGIGKTSLLGLLASRAAATGARVLRAHAVRDTKIPYQVFRDAWDGHAVGGPGGNRGTPGLPPFPAPPSHAPAHSDFQVGTKVRSALGQWASARGGVLVLDDLHHCGRQSAALAAQLVRTPVPGPFVLALAHRPRQTGSLLLEALEHGVHAGTVLRVEPDPLDVGEVAALLDHWRANGSAATERSPHAALPGQESISWDGSWEHLGPETYAEQLHAACGGNPRNLRILAAAGWHPDNWPERPGVNPDGLLREAVALTAELNALSPDATTAVGVAAVLGDPFLAGDVAEVSGLGLERTLGALGELARGDLIRPLHWGGRFAFRHLVLGHVALEHANPSLRLPARRRALDLLTARRAPAAARARHAEHLLGADGDAALQVLIEGATEAATEAPATAARWFRLALDTLPGGERISASRANLALDCCRALTAAGRLREARTLAHDVLGHHSDLPDELRLKAHAVCADVERLLGRYQEADAVVHAALDLLPHPLPEPMPDAPRRLILAYGQVQVWRGTYGQARALVREAARTAGEADQAWGTAVRVLAAFGETYLGDLVKAAPEVTRCARLVDGLPDTVAADMPETLALLGCAEMYLERFVDSYRHLSRGLEATSGGSQKHVLMNQLMGLSILDQWTGRLEDARRRAREAEMLARALGADDGEGLAMTMRAAALIWTRGRRDTAGLVALAQKGVRKTSRGTGWWASSAVGLLAHTQFVGGDPAGCLRTLLEKGGGEELRLVQPPFRPSLLGMLSTAALRCGDIGAARRWAQAAEADAQQLELPIQLEYVRRSRAALHATDGEHDAATELFHQSAEGFRRAGMPVQQAWTLVTGARSAQAAQGQDAALTWLDSALEISLGCGALRIREEAARVRAQVQATREPAVQGASATDQEAPDLLTTREREIAELAAAGKRSREIADQLFVSTRTVETHLSRIYRKLGISSRMALYRALQRMPDAGNR